MLPAQMAASPLPVEQRHLVQAASPDGLIWQRLNHVRIVSSSRGSAAATLAQLQPSSSSKIALARHTTPWLSPGRRITARKAVRSFVLGNPPRVIPKEESIQNKREIIFSDYGVNLL